MACVQEAEMQSDREPSVLDSRRIWIADQLAALIRNGSIPKDDEWTQVVLDFYIVNGLFVVRKRSEGNPIHAVCSNPCVLLIHGRVDNHGLVTNMPFTAIYGDRSTKLSRETS